NNGTSGARTSHHLISMTGAREGNRRQIARLLNLTLAGKVGATERDQLAEQLLRILAQPGSDELCKGCMLTLGAASCHEDWDVRVTAGRCLEAVATSLRVEGLFSTRGCGKEALNDQLLKGRVSLTQVDVGSVLTRGTELLSRPREDILKQEVWYDAGS
ncbi:unnamed protein product, partial [Chrysoparadoxa australica]